MIRSRRTLVGFAIAILVVAACLPGLAGIDYAVFELPWVLLPDVAPAEPPAARTPTAVQTASYRALLPSRAPPPPATA